MDRPSPVPLPVGLVVKKGCIIFSLMASGIPVPLSLTVIRTPFTPPSGGWGGRSGYRYFGGVFCAFYFFALIDGIEGVVVEVK